ncbi:MAG: TonB-dependent receptor plug domain-containing protein [Rhodothermales bacterium]
MKRCTPFYSAPLFVFTLLLASGCALSRPEDGRADAGKRTAEEERLMERRRSGPIAAAAGENTRWADVVDGMEAKRQPNASVEQLLAGQIAGVDVIRRANGAYSIRIRGGSSTILGGGEPLYVVDGFPVLSAYDGIMINPFDVKRIEVLKDVDSRALYGSRAANGVVLITTK